MISNEILAEITVEELRDFVELQCDDSVMHMDSEDRVVNYLRGHLRILHALILNEFTVDEATKALGRLEL